MSLDPTNPFQSPNFTDQPTSQFVPVNSLGLSPAILTQQRVISILLIVHGSLTVLVGLFVIGMSLLVPAALSGQMAQRPRPAGAPATETVVIIIYGVIATVALTTGVLQISGGICNLWLKNYGLGLAAIASCGLSIATCYCFPTGMALLIYGLIIYLNHSTKLAFNLAKQGHNFDSILTLSARGPVAS